MFQSVRDTISNVALTLVVVYLWCICYIILVIEIDSRQFLNDDSIYDLALTDSDSDNELTQLFNNFV